MNETNISHIQTIAIVVSVFFLLLILYLIKNKRIKEEYSLLWIFFSVIFIFFSVWREGLDYIAGLIGIAYPPAALFMVLLMAIFLILIEFSIIISKLADKNKTLAQEIGILRQKIKQMQDSGFKTQDPRLKWNKANPSDIPPEAGHQPTTNNQ
ncbi:MAG: DUF2304 domain-containing protein [Bacteroidota bacterium]|nr:DUF2304 domain-containing protein [Bacteroidota bacterium]